METTLPGDEISGHLHKATASLHSLLLLYADAGFESLPADKLQEMLLTLVSNVTNASRLFTQHQKQQESLANQSAELVDTVRRLSPLVRDQQEQIKALRAELDEKETADSKAARTMVDTGTMTEMNVSALEEQLLVSGVSRASIRAS